MRQICVDYIKIYLDAVLIPQGLLWYSEIVIPIYILKTYINVHTPGYPLPHPGCSADQVEYIPHEVRVTQQGKGSLPGPPHFTIDHLPMAHSTIPGSDIVFLVYLSPRTWFTLHEFPLDSACKLHFGYIAWFLSGHYIFMTTLSRVHT